MTSTVERGLMAQRWRGGWATVLALLIAMTATVAADDWSTVEEHWFKIEIASASAGWSKTIISRRGDTYRTHTTTNMRIRRGESIVEVKTQEAFIEHADGTPVRMKRIESPGSGKIEHEWQFGSDSVMHITRGPGRETKRELSPPEGVWLTPRAASRFLGSRRDAGAKEITYRTLSPESGLTPITVSARHVRDGQYEFDGRTLPVTVWRNTLDTMPIVVVEHISADGLTLKQEVELGASRMVMRRSSREDIERLIAEGDAADAPELLISNLVTPDRPIQNVHDARRAALRLRVPNGPRPSLPEAGAQRVKPDDGDEGAVIVTIDVDDPVAAPRDESTFADYLAPSSLIDFEHEQVRELARIKPMSDNDPMAIAWTLQRRVHRHISVKTLDVAFASASETALTRLGDCTEHAVLLAAVLRANDIPARIATGLVYADHFAGRDHVFGWHMWTQAWIDGKWWDFDAVLPRERFHAGYVLISTSALSDDRRYAGLDAFIQLLGSIEIDVINVEHNAPTTQQP